MSHYNEIRRRLTDVVNTEHEKRPIATLVELSSMDLSDDQLADMEPGLSQRVMERQPDKFIASPDPTMDDEPCERCGFVETCMCGEPRHDVDPRDLT